MSNTSDPNTDNVRRCILALLAETKSPTGIGAGALRTLAATRLTDLPKFYQTLLSLVETSVVTLNDDGLFALATGAATAEDVRQCILAVLDEADHAAGMMGTTIRNRVRTMLPRLDPRDNVLYHLKTLVDDGSVSRTDDNVFTLNALDRGSSGESDATDTRSQEKVALDRLIDAGADSRVDVTPAMASAMLARSNNFRRVEWSDVTRLAADMTAGRWTHNGAAIEFDVDGNLINGQHRCHACINSGVTLTNTLVVFDSVDQDIDSGRTRTITQWMSHDGIASAGAWTSNATLLAYLTYAPRGLSDIDNTGRRPTRAQVRSIKELYPELVEAVTAVPTRSVTGTPLRSWYPSLHCIFAQKDPALADTFLNQLTEPGALSQGFVLARSLIGVSARKERVSKTIRAWNALRRGRPLRRIRRVSDGTVPEIR